MTAFIGSRQGGISYAYNTDARNITKMRPYFDVAPPHSYVFMNTKRIRYWHLEDLEMFRRFIGMALHDKPDKENPAWDAEGQVWRPKYLSPPDFSERYDDATKARVLDEA